MEIAKKLLIKDWTASKTSIIFDSFSNKFIEKEYILNSNPYFSNELEIYEEILCSLSIDAAKIIESEINGNKVSFILEYINGIDCSENPNSDFLYLAAEKAGEIYKKSARNIDKIESKYIDKYSLTKEKVFKSLEFLGKFFEFNNTDFLIEKIFFDFKEKELFVNHFDMHLKNFIFNNGKICLIDWASMLISPFYCDLYILLSQAEEINASKNKIIEIYEKASHMSISEKDIIASGIIYSIISVERLLRISTPEKSFFFDWAKDLYKDLMELLIKINSQLE